ncbi:MAG: hypothetical protein Q4Q58_05425 [Thermoplasmata archaeon]|nr:hypothetical protein [Thermoplasmata archaeon]
MAVAAVLLCVPLAAADLDAETTGFDITDDTGTTYHFDGAADHLVVQGAGAVLTVADAGAVDKIVAVDKYSTYSYTGYEQLANLNAVDLGSFYGTTNHDAIVTELLNLVEAGSLHLDDPIILTSYSANATLKERLEDLDFTRVLSWNTSSGGDYSGIVSFVRDVTLIATGEESTSVTEMQSIISQVQTTVSGATEKTRAIALWYSSSSGLQIINTGIAANMLEVCNAENIGYDASNSSMRYGDTNTIIQLLGENPGTVIFLSNAWETAGKTVQDFYDEVLGGSTDYKVVLMGALWNNYCPESADGLLSMAQSLYPELFGIEDEDNNGGSGDGSNAVLWGAAAVIVILIIAAAYVAFKRTHG